jgi:hypothetical protein
MSNMEGYIIYLMFGYIIYRDIINDKRIKDLLNRIMARNFEEHQYYAKKYDKDLKEVGKMRDEAREERDNDLKDVVDSELDNEEKKIMSEFDEDWADNEVDKTKVADLIKD